MWWKNFFKEEDGVVSTEYVVFVAVIGILLAAGVTVLFAAMRDYFFAWAAFFGG